MKKIYLAHPIFSSTVDIERYVKIIKENLESWGFEVIDPTDFGLKEEDHITVIETCKKKIKECVLVVAVTVVPSWGTAMEMYFSHGEGIPVYAWTGAYAIPAWVKGHAHCFSDMNEMVGFIAGKYGE